MPDHGIAAKRRTFQIASAHEQRTADAPATPFHDENDSVKVAGAQFQAVLAAIGQALTPENFFGIVQAPQPLPLRDAPIVLQTIHNPTAQAVAISFSLDPGSAVLFATSLAAGATLTSLGLEFPRLAGFVTPTTPGGYVTFGGTLPKGT